MQIKTISIITLLIFSMLWPGPVDAQTNQPTVITRVSFSPKKNIWVGQRVNLYIDVLGLDGWAKIKHASNFEISGAIVIRIETQGTRLQETIGDGSYTGQRYELLVYPKRAGMIKIPVISLEVEIKQWGVSVKPAIKRIKTPAKRFRALIPPGAQGEQELISTTKFQARQRWEPKTEKVKVGDSLKRMLTFQAADVPGSAFTPLSYDPVDKVSIYPAQSIVKDRYDRGSLTGFRSETITYVFQKPGKVLLPDVVITWWDMANKQLKRKTLKGRTLDVAINPAVPASTVSQTPGKSSVIGNWWPLLVLAMISALGWAFHRRLQTRLQSRRQERQESEAAYFRQFLKLLRSKDPRTILNALMRWLDRMHQGREAPRLDIFLNQYGDNIAKKETNELIQAVTSGASRSWNGRRLSRSLKMARSRWLSEIKQQVLVKSYLPKINPTY